MPIGVGSFDTVSRGTANRPIRRSQPSARRAVFLLGTSLLVYAALPSAALAQQECGAPPVGGGTVTCPPSLNPYPNGITYDNQVNDLTIVLQPSLAASDRVSATSFTTGVDLRLEGRVNTTISTVLASHNGAHVTSGSGTSYAGVDHVSTSGNS